MSDHRPRRFNWLLVNLATAFLLVGARPFEGQLENGGLAGLAPIVASQGRNADPDMTSRCAHWRPVNSAPTTRSAW